MRENDFCSPSLLAQKWSNGAFGSREQLRDQREFLDQLSRNPATASGELEAVAKIITEGCARLLKVERVGVWLFDDSETELRCVDQFNLASGEHSSGAVLYEHEFRDEFQYMKNSLYVDASDPYFDPRTAGYVEGYLKPNGITSMLDVVIRFGGRNLGTLCIEHVKRTHTWEQSEIDFGCIVGAQLSILLERRALNRAETARREVQDRLKAVEDLDALKSRFFSNMSHEFRTPLTLLLAPVENLLSGAKDVPSDWQRGQLAMVRRGALRMLKLVNSLMDSVRIGSGRANVTFRPTDLAALTKDLAGQFEGVVTTAGLRLIVNCEPLPELAYVDQDAWEKIVLNFLSNALKFTFKGEIFVGLRAVGNQFELTVQDTGVGVAPDALPHIFDRFYRVPEAQGRTVEGTGIGLALVKELVQLHGGTVQVESEPGRGSTFRLHIPRGHAHIPPERIRIDQRDTSLGGPSSGPSPLVEEALGWLSMDTAVASELFVAKTGSRALSAPKTERAKILIAEDNTDMRRLLIELLNSTYEVEGVSDGIEALASIRACPPDLVISDIMMPRLDGVRLLKELRADPSTSGIPIILISARCGSDLSLENLAVPADDYIGKPFSPREVTARVGSLIALKRARELLQNALSSQEQDLEKLVKAAIQKGFESHRQ